MSNNGGNHHNLSIGKSFRILKQDDKFFSKLMSKETSMANSSSRKFYYGESSIASVPFVWEEQPGTPKHPLCENSLPPLTPPPSYYTNSKSNHKRRGSKLGFNSTIAMFSCILPRSRKNIHVSPSSSWSSSASSSSSSSSSSSWSLVYPSSSRSIRDKDQGSLSFSHDPKNVSNGFRGCYSFGSMKKNAILRHEEAL